MVAAELHQMTFAAPEQAAEALVAAARAGKTTDLEKIFGLMGRKLIYSGDRVADQDGREKLVSGYDQKHAIDQQSDSRAILIIGADELPFPIALVKQGGAWRFDTKDGAEEIFNRRIGRNELNAIEVCGAIVDAEHDYARQDRTGAGYLEYAQKFMSSPRQAGRDFNGRRPPARRARSDRSSPAPGRRARPPRRQQQAITLSRIFLQAAQTAGQERAGRRLQLCREGPHDRRLRPGGLSGQVR